MALPKMFRGNASQEAKRMLGLDVGFEVVTASLWSASGGQVKVLKVSSPIEWQETKPQELAEAADVAFEELGKEASDVDGVILGLQEDWIEQDRVLASKKPFLKTSSCRR
jgi:hypothetical protein